MKKSCPRCGRIHEDSAPCFAGNSRRKKVGEIERFRSSIAWQKMRAYIRERDGYLCRVCLEKDELTRDKYQTRGLQVHHIVPLAEDFGKRLDEDNLITLCARCHEDAEKGRIARERLRAIVATSEDPPRG